ncbi:MAG: hypothetical protein GY893_04695, partial [bacterium]|nr:hypothetical protein [bacterium]
MKPWKNIFLSAVLVTGSVQAQFAEGQTVLHGAIGPAFSYMMSLELDQTAFGLLSNFTADFDISDAAEVSGINSNGMVVTGFEGFGEVTPHWTIGMYAGQGEYIASAQDAADVDYTINFVLSSVGVTAEFNTHSRSRLKLLGGSLFGLGQASLVASSSPGNESWSDITSGSAPRKAFELSAWTPVIQPYLDI